MTLALKRGWDLCQSSADDRRASRRDEARRCQGLGQEGLEDHWADLVGDQGAPPNELGAHAPSLRFEHQHCIAGEHAGDGGR